MNYIEQIEAMHQQVREYVENMEPNYKVTSVDAYFSTNYAPTLASQGEVLPRQDFILVDANARFKVSASYIGRRLSCEVWVASDGSLHTGDRLISV